MSKKRYADGPLTSASSAVAVTPHNTNEVAQNGTFSRALFVGVGGDVMLRLADDTGDVTFKNVQSGQVLDVQAKLVKATGTTATDIVALF